MIKPRYDLIGWRYNKEMSRTCQNNFKKFAKSLHSPCNSATHWWCKWSHCNWSCSLGVFATELGAAVTENMFVTTSYPLLRTERKTSQQSSSMLPSSRNSSIIKKNMRVHIPRNMHFTNYKLQTNPKEIIPFQNQKKSNDFPNEKNTSVKE